MLLENLNLEGSNFGPEPPASVRQRALVPCVEKHRHLCSVFRILDEEKRFFSATGYNCQIAKSYGFKSKL